MTHYGALFIGYGVALAGWLLVNRLLPQLWASPVRPVFAKPWREVGWALLAVVGVLLVGQVFLAGGLLPERGVLRPVWASLNQVLIFSPLLVVLWVRKQGPETAWLPRDRVGARVAVGLGLALVTMTVFLWVRAESHPWTSVLAAVYQPKNLAHLVQVLLEDFAIALVFVRIRAALGLRWAIVLVAALFAAGHVPAMLAGGTPWHELGSLLLDTTLGIGVLAVLQRSADIWWFWQVHFMLDMMQYYAAP